jgi:protein-S-isoprenylcysteine O-methyltransferase Ste14
LIKCSINIGPARRVVKEFVYSVAVDRALILLIICSIWIASEIAVGIARHAGARSSGDRGSLIIIWIVITAAVFGGSALRNVEATGMPPGFFWIGITLIVAGVVVRWIAILTLQRYFTVNVVIQEGHELIDRRIYAVVRHPAYSGTILSFIGLGFAFQNWLSLALILVFVLLGFSYRIRVEEQVLIAHFGDRYRDYARRTKRLIPGIL